MAIVKWQPNDELSMFQSSIDDLFDDYFAKRELGTGKSAGAFPFIDISETKDEFILSGELPGVKKEDLKVTVDNNTLTIKGEKKQEKEDKGRNYLRVERSYGAFSRSFTLSTNIDANRIKSSFKDGVLEVKLPKKETEKAKEIEIEVK